MSTYECSITNPKKQLEFYRDLSEQLQVENNQLKKQLEETQTDYEKEKYIVDKQTRQLADEYKNTEYQTSKVKELENKQKEFIEYLEKRYKDINSVIGTYGSNTDYLYGRREMTLEILLKYKKIVGE